MPLGHSMGNWDVAKLKNWQLLTWEAGDDWTALPPVEEAKGAQPLLSSATQKKCTGDSGFFTAGIRGALGKRIDALAPTTEAKIDHSLVDARRFLALCRQAMAAGAVQKGRTLHWQLSARSKHPCLAPREVAHLRGVRPLEWVDRLNPVVGLVETIGFLVMHGRCRKCDNCRKADRLAWIARMNLEGAQATAREGRIWFVTLTSGEHHREEVERAAHHLAWRDRCDFHRLTPEEQFSYRSAAFKPFVSGFMKRLRTPFLVECKEDRWQRSPPRLGKRGTELNSRVDPVTGQTVRRKPVGDAIKAQCRDQNRVCPDFTYSRRIEPCLRFAAVTEPHSGKVMARDRAGLLYWTGEVNEWLRGRAHAHLLVFEADRDHGIFEHRFREAWSRFGFAEAELAKDQARVGRYLAKYLTKDMRGAIWASEHFGRPQGQAAR